MIIKKTPHQIEEMAEAGRLSAKVLREVGARVKPGVSTAELDRIAEMIIRMEGGIPAFKGYGGFPGSICASVNDQIVHGIPSNSVILQEGDILSIDTGAIVKGWVGDNAWTYPVGKISPEKCAGICSFAWRCLPSTAFTMRRDSAAPATPGAPLLRSKIQHTRIEKLEAKNLITYPDSPAERPIKEAQG